MAKKNGTPYNYLPMQFPRPDKGELLSLMEATLSHSNITERIIAAITRVALRGDFTLGREVGEFEEAWSKVVGTRHAIGMSNGTDAIAIALDAAGLQEGDEVITSPVTFPATTGAIIQAGGIPKFVDIERVDAPNITIGSTPALVMDAAKWFVPVLWGGNPYGMDGWNKLGGATVVLDAAQGVNALSQGKKLGDLERIAAMAYSLHPLKNINVWGDGGMIATSQRSIDHNSRLLRNHGFVGRDVWERPGFNSRLSTVQAAVGLEVLPLVDAMTKARENNARLYNSAFTGIDGITTPYVEEGDQHGWHLYQIIVEERDSLVAYLNEQGVEAKVHYDTPLHLQQAMRPLHHTPGDFPIAEQFCRQNVTLPIHEYLTERQLGFAISSVKAWAKAGS